jgi:Protein of unknown function (DUF2958)
MAVALNRLTGPVSLAGPLKLPLHCDLHFAPTRTIAPYAERARKHRRIIT